MNIQETKRIAELLGFEVFHAGGVCIAVSSGKSKNYIVDFCVNSDFAIMRMIEKLQGDDFLPNLYKNRTELFYYGADVLGSYCSQKQFNKGGLAEVFLQVYGNGCEHNWACGDNQVVTGAEVCTKCKLIRSADIGNGG